MAAKQGRSKTPRDDKRGRPRGNQDVKTGHRGARRTKLSESDKVRMGKGIMQHRKEQRPGYQGVSHVVVPWDPAQARLNEELGYC